MQQEKTRIVCNEIHKPFGNYSHGVLNNKTGLLVTSGQLGVGKDGHIPYSFSEQAELCFFNVSAIIEEAGFELKDVMRVNTFLTARENFQEYMSVRDKFFEDVIIKPASTLLIVSGFTKPDFLIEVEVIAQK